MRYMSVKCVMPKIEYELSDDDLDKEIVIGSEEREMSE